MFRIPLRQRPARERCRKLLPPISELPTPFTLSPSLGRTHRFGVWVTQDYPSSEHPDGKPIASQPPV